MDKWRNTMYRETFTFKTDTETGFINVTVNKSDYDEYDRIRKEGLESLKAKAIKIEDCSY